MRSKKTIRRMKGTPLARKLAYLAIESRSLTKRLDYMVAEVQDLELTARTYERALREHGWDTGAVGRVIAAEAEQRDLCLPHDWKPYTHDGLTGRRTEICVHCGEEREVDNGV